MLAVPVRARMYVSCMRARTTHNSDEDEAEPNSKRQKVDAVAKDDEIAQEQEDNNGDYSP
jgi:hypothetical protein